MYINYVYTYMLAMAMRDLENIRSSCITAEAHWYYQAHWHRCLDSESVSHEFRVKEATFS